MIQFDYSNIANLKEKVCSNKPQRLSIVLLATGLTLISLSARGDSYDLRSVKGIDSFSGSASAKELLGKNRFVVAEPTFASNSFNIITNSVALLAPISVAGWGSSVYGITNPNIQFCENQNSRPGKVFEMSEFRIELL